MYPIICSTHSTATLASCPTASLTCARTAQAEWSESSPWDSHSAAAEAKAIWRRMRTPAALWHAAQALETHLHLRTRPVGSGAVDVPHERVEELRAPKYDRWIGQVEAPPSQAPIVGDNERGGVVEPLHA